MPPNKGRKLTKPEPNGPSQLPRCYADSEHAMRARLNRRVSPPDDTAPSGLAAIVRSYRIRCEARAQAELQTFTDEPTLFSAVQRASLAQDLKGKRYHHQRRLSPSTLQVVLATLRHAPLAACRSFHELHELVRREIGPLHGVGRLMIYDTALRIGAKLGLEPDRVYLHAGTRQGARNLGLDWRARFIEVNDLPAELRALPPQQVEDILCIYKDHLGSGAA